LFSFPPFFPPSLFSFLPSFHPCWGWNPGSHANYASTVLPSYIASPSSPHFVFLFVCLWYWCFNSCLLGRLSTA
jgi:hypothetical protein